MDAYILQVRAKVCLRLTHQLLKTYMHSVNFVHVSMCCQILAIGQLACGFAAGIRLDFKPSWRTFHKAGMNENKFPVCYL